MTNLGDREFRCRDCSSPGPGLIIADGQPWVEDEDDVGFPYCPACVRGLVRQTMRIVS